MSENLIRTWIVNNKNMPIGDLIKNLDFVSYGYRKYGETVFAMKQGPWNVPLANLSKDLHDGTRKGYEDTKEFAEYLGERIVLCLKYFKGKTNKEIEQEICLEDTLRTYGTNAVYDDGDNYAVTCDDLKADD